MSGGFVFSVHTDPTLDAVARAMRQGASRLRDFRPVLRDAMSDMVGSVRDNFSSQNGPDWGQWPQPTSQYARRKAADGYGSTQMVRTGALNRAATSSGSVLHASGRSIVMGVKTSDYPQAWNNFPTDRRGKPRQFMGWTPRARAAVEGKITKYINVIMADTLKRGGR